LHSEEKEDDKIEALTVANVGISPGKSNEYIFQFGDIFLNLKRGIFADSSMEVLNDGALEVFGIVMVFEKVKIEIFVVNQIKFGP
jgi:hypothetical protein